jgi:carboxyl-terminal processing protease
MKIKRTILAPVLVATLAMATGGWFLQRGVGQERNLYANARLFEDVLRFVSESFVDQKQPTELYQMAIDGMLEQPGRPAHVADGRVGLRAAADADAGRVRRHWRPDRSAQRLDHRDLAAAGHAGRAGGTSGRRPDHRGERRVDAGTGTSTWRSASCGGRRAARSTSGVARGGVEEPIPVRIVREEIHIQAVPSVYLMDGDVGYVEMVSFSESATNELRQAVQRLRSEGARGVILDLRRNPGGLLDQGVSVADLFLDRGQTVVETKGRVANQNQRASARSADQFPGLPVVVLVDQQSASASEIVAGALQDHDRALVLGRTTYGKGSVQTLFPLPGQNWLKINTARWYTPVGRSIQKPYGIDAHMVEEPGMPGPMAVPVPDDDADRPEYQTDSGRTVYGGGGIHPDLVIMPDTLTLDERAYRSATLRSPDFFGARLAFAVEYIRRNPGLERGFDVTEAMRDAYFRQLNESGIQVDRAIFDLAERWVDQEIAYEITYSKWGEQAARQRINAEDPQVLAAAQLLSRATTPASLFALAASYDPASVELRSAGAEPVTAGR